MKQVDIGEPTSFLDHVYLGCNQRECKSNARVSEEYREMFESRISAGATEKLPAWPFDMEGHVQTCVETYCELATKASSLCLDDHHFKEEELKSVGELPQVCSKIVSQCLYMARIGRFDILRSVNKICPISHQVDESLWPTFSSFDFKHSPTTHVNSNSIVMWETRLSTVDWVYTKTPIFAGDFEDSKNVGVNLMFYRKSNICLHQLDVQEANCCFIVVSHSAAESGIISLDAALRTDG